MPNTRLTRFSDRVDAGGILLMVDVAFRRLDEIHEMVARLHPDAAPGGVEPTIPAFP
jgi:hypothetical protein